MLLCLTYDGKFDRKLVIFHKYVAAKTRRLYDIANVFVSLNLIEKVGHIV